MKKGFLAVVIGFILLAPGCSTGKYYWGGYERTLYHYHKNPEDIDKFAESLAYMIEKGESQERVPPGIYAEYGYILFIQNKKGEAISCFEKEKERWPESTHLMNIMIETANIGKEREQSSDVSETGVETLR